MADIIEAMLSPDVDKSAGFNAVVENEITCRASKPSAGKNPGKPPPKNACDNGEIEKDKMCFKAGRIVTNVCNKIKNNFCPTGFEFYDDSGIPLVVFVFK